MLILLTGSGCVGGLFYHPMPVHVDSPRRLGLVCEDVFFRGEDDTLLHGWFLPASSHPARGTVVHVHGNAQNISTHYRYVAWLVREGYQVFTFDYRGYGLSEGRPDRAGVLGDTRAAIRYAASRPDVDPDRLIVFGQSLGGANAVAAVASMEAPIPRAVIVDSAFYSYRSIVSDKVDLIPGLRWLRGPLSWVLIGNEASPGPVIGRLAPVPVMILHSETDPIVPAEHGRRLYEAAGEPKIFCRLPGAGHAAALGPQRDVMRPVILMFIEQALDGGIHEKGLK